MPDLSTVSSVITTVSVVTGIIFALMQLRHLNKVRKAEIIMKVYDKFSSKEMLSALSYVRTSKFENIEEYLRKHGAQEAGRLGSSSKRWVFFLSTA